MANDLALSVVLGATMSNGFNGVFGNASKSVGQLGQAVKATHIQLNQIASYQRTESALDATRAKLGATQAKAMALRKEMAETGGSAKLTKALGTTQSQAVKLSSTLETQRAKLRQEGDALRKAGIDTNDLSGANERLTRTFEKQKSALGANYALMEKRKALRGQLMGQVAKLAGTVLFGKKAIDSAVDFESAMADVRKVVDFDTPQQFAQMGQAITDLSLKLPMARDGIAGIVAAGAQAGLPRKELLRFAEDAAKMGVAFDTTAEDAGQKMAQWRKAFNLTQDQVVALGDQVNLLGNTAGASSLDISEILSQVGPLGKVGGLAGGQIAALGATMRSMGIDTATAGTGVKNLMLAMTAGTAATPKQSAALQALGIDAKLLAKRMTHDAAGAIVAVMMRLRALPKEAQAATLTQLLGREAVGAVAPLLANLDELKKNLHAVGDASKYSGSMQQEFLSRASTTDMALKVGKNAWDALTGSIGKVFLPTLKVVVGSFVKLTSGIVALADRFPRITGAIVAAVTALLTFKTALIVLKLVGTFLPSLASFGGIVRALVPGLGLAKTAVMLLGGAMRATSLAFLASPIGLVIGAIVLALVGAVLVIRKYWEPIKAFFTGVWQGISEAAGPTFKAIGDALAPLKPVWDGFVSVLSAVWNWFGKLLEPVHSTSAQLESATSAGKIFGEALVTAFNLITWPIRTNIKLIMWLGEKIGEVVGWVVTRMPEAADAISGAWNGALDFVGGLWDALKAKIAAVVDWVSTKIEWVANKWATLKGLPGAVWGDIKDAGAALGSTMAGPTPALAAAGGPALNLPAPRGAGYTDNSTHGPTTISVQAGPGMDEKALAQEVRKQLDDRDRAHAARSRSKLGDTD